MHIPTQHYLSMYAHAGHNQPRSKHLREQSHPRILQPTDRGQAAAWRVRIPQSMAPLDLHQNTFFPLFSFKPAPSSPLPPQGLLQRTNSPSGSKDSHLEEYRALDDFSADDSSQISFRKGDQVFVKKKDVSGREAPINLAIQYIA